MSFLPNLQPPVPWTAAQGLWLEVQQGFLGSGFGSWATGTDLAVSLLSAPLEIVPNWSNSGQE